MYCQVSRIQLESGDKLARLSLEIEGENESKAEADRKIKEMRADVSTRVLISLSLFRVWQQNALNEVVFVRCSLRHASSPPSRLDSCITCISSQRYNACKLRTQRSGPSGRELRRKKVH